MMLRILFNSRNVFERFVKILKIDARERENIAINKWGRLCDAMFFEKTNEPPPSLPPSPPRLLKDS